MEAGTSSRPTDAASRAPQPAWPNLPTTEATARATIYAATKRATGLPLPELDSARLVRRIGASIDRRDLVVGSSAIDAWIAERMRRSLSVDRTAYLLLGM